MALPPKIKKDLDSILDSSWEFLKNKIPKWLASLILVFIVVLIYLAWPVLTSKTASYILGDDNVGKETKAPTNLSDDANGNESRESNLEPRAAGASTDFTNWVNHEKFDSHSDNNKILCPAFSAYYPEGRSMYWPLDMNSKFRANFNIKPLSQTRGNIVFEFEKIFRCIIGANYKHIDCESYPFNANYLTERNQKQVHPWINRENGAKPRTEQFLTVVSEPVPNSELVNVKLELRFIPADTQDGQYKTEYFEYSIPTGKPAEQLQSRIGLGIIDPKKYRPYQPDEACAEFLSFEINQYQ